MQVIARNLPSFYSLHNDKWFLPSEGFQIQVVLNLQDGLPSPEVNVTLEKQDGKNWNMLNSGATNEQGRITALYPEDKALEKGTYRVTFKTGEWFKKHATASFFPEVPVIFEVDGTVPHYHIPLLLSPYGFSTYRGN